MGVFGEILRSSRFRRLAGTVACCIALLVGGINPALAFPPTGTGGASLGGNLTAFASNCPAVAGVTTSCVTIPIANVDTLVTIGAYGTFVATGILECTYDSAGNTGWTAINIVPVASAISQANFSATGNFQGNVSGCALARVRVSAFTSGTVSVIMQASTASTGALGAGGGSSQNSLVLGSTVTYSTGLSQTTCQTAVVAGHLLQFWNKTTTAMANDVLVFLTNSTCAGTADFDGILGATQYITGPSVGWAITTSFSWKCTTAADCLKVEFMSTTL